MDELKIHISTPADTTGAKATAAAVREVAGATGQASAAGKEHASTTKEVAHELGGMAKASKSGAAAGQLFSEALQGNIGALLHLGPLLKATKTAITASFAGLATFGAGALIALFPTIIAWIRGTLDAAEEARKKAKEATDAFGEEKSAAEKLNEAKLNGFKAELDGINERAEAAKGFLDALFEIQGKLAQSQENLELAKINADATLTPEEKMRRSAAVKERYKSAADSREDEKAREELAQKERTAQEARALAEKQAAEAAALHAQRAENLQAPEERARVKKFLEQQINNIDRENAVQARVAVTSTGFGAGAGFSAPGDPVRAHLEAQLRYIEAREKTLDFAPDAIRRRSALDQRVNNADAAAKESAAKAASAQRELENAQSIQSVRDGNNPRIRSLDRATARVPVSAADAEALDRGEIPDAYRALILRRGMAGAAKQLATGHNILSDRLDAATAAAAQAGAQTAEEMVRAIKDAIGKAFGASSPMLAKVIGESVQAGMAEAAGDIRQELRTVQTAQQAMQSQIKNGDRR